MPRKPQACKIKREGAASLRIPELGTMLEYVCSTHNCRWSSNFDYTVSKRPCPFEGLSRRKEDAKKDE